jgi:hypothetical protein
MEVLKLVHADAMPSVLLATTMELIRLTAEPLAASSEIPTATRCAKIFSRPAVEEIFVTTPTPETLPYLQQIPSASALLFVNIAKIAVATQHPAEPFANMPHKKPASVSPTAMLSSMLESRTPN